MLIFVSILLHPILLLANSGFDFGDIFNYGDSDDIWLGIIGLILLITYDIGKSLKRYNFFTRNWNNILLISTIGFLLIFPYSLGLGSDLQSGVPRVIWIFYGITALLATIYTYGIKRFSKQKTD